jgi:hypothetical protein
VPHVIRHNLMTDNRDSTSPVSTASPAVSSRTRARNWPSWRSFMTCIRPRSRRGRHNWVEGAAGLFCAGLTGKYPDPEVDLRRLHAEIGELTLENDFCWLHSARSAIRAQGGDREIGTRQASTPRLHQSITAARYTKPWAIGM